MYISNSAILPRDWTAETLMQAHKSRPFNPSIAHVFYRAGYIEAWGRGIEKICEACRELGAPDPEYTVLGDDITVKFTALVAPKTSGPKTPNRHDGGLSGGLDDGLENKILELISREDTITVADLARRLSVSKRTTERSVKMLREQGKLERVGGNRHGHWEIKE